MKRDIIMETKKTKKVSEETTTKSDREEEMMTESAQQQKLRKKILEGTIEAFNQKGMKFTMDDLAGILGMSKKTIYNVFSDKTSLFLSMVDYLFDTIKLSEQEIMEDEKLSTAEKIRAVLGVMPDSYKEINFAGLYLLKEKHPAIYERVEKRLESGWEMTMGLLELGIEEGCIRPVNLSIFKMMMEAALEQFFQRNILINSGLSYTEGLSEVVGILLDGIEKKEQCYER